MQTIKNYKFSSHILLQLHSLKTDNWHGFLYVLEDWSIIFIAIFISWFSWKNTSFILAFPIYIVSIFIIGSRQYALSEIMHQATHKTLAKSRLINFFLGTYISGYLVFGSFSGFFFHMSNIILI